ncbi:MAG: cryptochrome/photolyase family protein, partial [Deltaproteobacteria bacterium]|nr:cryptochrome/photolyase family protein [Deltaproteobacteria bacterium]
MSVFKRELAAIRVSKQARRWVFVAPDQLNDAIGPLARLSPREAGIVLVETPAKAARRPYHKQKLALVLANLRHFALEQARRGVAVRHVVSEHGYAEALREVARETGPLLMMEAAERELRVELAPLVQEKLLEVGPHEGWLTTRAQFEESQGHRARAFRMDAFYRHVRRATGVLMAGTKPVGGKWSFDVENREAWDGEPPAPPLQTFPRDAIKDEVGALIERHFARHPGELSLDTLPATRADAEALWARALTQLPWFGPFEDAMSTRSSGLFHSRVSGLLNLHRLLPERLVREAAASDAGLPSREGFVRQILGWREFVRHVHVATDGFRVLPEVAQESEVTGDGGFARWSGAAWAQKVKSKKAWPVPEGAAPAKLQGRHPLPVAYWGTRSGMRCLDSVVADVWREAYSHHITRLMVLGNFATLLGVSARELTDWFWVAYLDAYDWVVEPNVLGMATFAAGDVMTTKPYVAGAAYIDRMSDYCGGCALEPKTTCPVTPLYWAFLARNEPVLRGNPRLMMPL